MPEPKPIQNKPLLFAVIALMLVAAFGVVYLKNGMGHDQARALAVSLLPQVCARDCASRGLQVQDLQGPEETDLNRQPRTTKFEFVWRTTGGRSLRIRVWDNGLTIQKGEKWNDMDQWQRL